MILKDLVTDTDERHSMLLEFKDYPDEFPPEKENEGKLFPKEINNSTPTINKEKKELETKKQLSKIDFKFDESSDDSSSEEDLPSFILNQDNDADKKIVSAPKHLYDCLLGLKSENKERVELSFKNLPYLIRKNLNDLNALAADITILILKSEQNLYNIEKFNEYREKSLISLVIGNPEKTSRLNYYYSILLYNQIILLYCNKFEFSPLK